ncbi:biotin/lipoate--protein ligase family protein [Siccirubricoccus sp. KC 17139]|uniref:Biotin/lipoate--protein ligase family protein n=1 Tax=Siccirubricoccus soli TaxID=2899147 RepID=A0ABT1D5Q2_9PROT|nr:biotin/lipoate--protein ligase family protein [Siccirubricoccus soli]MCP2683361.1 biotin/lipoate--protein ligase family protein [Siccirubricoccus soli]
MALAPREGAGCLTWVSAYARAEAAVVLEPELPLAQARLAFHAAANALADAVAALGPPERAVALRWPGRLLVEGGECGCVRLAAPPGAATEAVPDWLVVGMELRLAFPEGHAPGETPDQTSLFEEGFPVELDAAALTAAWARHLMAGLEEWQARGPQRLIETLLARLAEAPAAGRRGIEPGTGALVVERDGMRERWDLPW